MKCSAEDMGQEFLKPLKNTKQNQYLQDKQHKHQPETAEYGMDNPLLPLL